MEDLSTSNIVMNPIKTANFLSGKRPQGASGQTLDIAVTVYSKVDAEVGYGGIISTSFFAN